MNAHTGIVIIAALHPSIWDYLYFALVILACLIWLAATILYIDKKMRERRWRKRDAARPGYVDLTVVHGFSATTNMPAQSDLFPSASAE